MLSNGLFMYENLKFPIQIWTKKVLKTKQEN